MIVLALIGMLASIAVPSYVRARSNGQRSACVNNLRQIDGAIQQWALENRRPPDTRVNLDDAKPYLKSPPVCEAGGTTMENSYLVTSISDPPKCVTPGGGAPHLHVLPQ